MQNVTVGPKARGYADVKILDKFRRDLMYVWKKSPVGILMLRSLAKVLLNQVSVRIYFVSNFFCLLSSDSFLASTRYQAGCAFT